MSVSRACLPCQVFAPTRIALRLMLLCFVRTSELIETPWSEIDLERGEWIIPWQRMKRGKLTVNPDMTNHHVCLSRQALELLRELHTITGRSKHLFPNQRDHEKPISNNTLLVALGRMGYKGKMTGHGFRALAMSTIKERLGYRHEVVDRQLAHAPKDKVASAYDRAQFLAERRRMMQDWADYIDAVSGKGTPPQTPRLMLVNDEFSGDAKIDQATPREKPYKLFDGAGLFIEVQPSGSKIWRMKYRQPDRSENALTFGRTRTYVDGPQVLKHALDPRTEFNHEKLHPRPEPVPLDELFDEADWGHVQTSIWQTTQYAIRHLEATLFPALARIPTDDTRRSIQRICIRKIEQAGLQDLYRHLEGIATALAGSYLSNGMSADELAIAMKDNRKRMRRAIDVAGPKSHHSHTTSV
eukprot:gene30842-38124_t